MIFLILSNLQTQKSNFYLILYSGYIINVVAYSDLVEEITGIITNVLFNLKENVNKTISKDVIPPQILGQIRAYLKQPKELMAFEIYKIEMKKMY